MKKLIIITSTLIIASLLNSCGNVKLTSNDVSELIITENAGKDPFAGINIGDDWDEIKEKYAKDWEIKEDGGLYKEWDFYNHVFINLDLNDEGKVETMNMNFEVSVENNVELLELKQLLETKYNLIYDQTSEESWKMKTNPDYNVTLMVLDKLGKVKKNSSLTIRVESY